MTEDRVASKECRRFTHLLGAYVDGELPTEAVLSLDEHVTSCPPCSERVALDRATRGSLKQVVRAEGPSETMKGRFQAAVRAELVRSEARTERRGPPLGSVALPLAAAAVLLGVGLSRSGWLTKPPSALVADDDVLNELVAVHSRPLPPERTDPKDVRAFEQYVGVPVRTVSAQDGGARLVGGRMLALHQERAAMLEYEVDKHRVSVFIYDPRQVHVHDDSLAPRSFGTSEVRSGRSNGYSVAVGEHEGVGYAVASDLDAQRTAEFAVYMESAGN